MEILHRRHLAFFVDNEIGGRKKLVLQSGFIDLGGERPP
jgi:hypothetical protein